MIIKNIIMLVIILAYMNIFSNDIPFYNHGVSSIIINGNQYYVTNSSHSEPVSIGVPVTFTINTIYEVENFDDRYKAYTEVRFWEDGNVVEKKTIIGFPNGQVITHYFSNAGNVKVAVKVRHKNMTDKEFDELSEFVVNIISDDLPSGTDRPWRAFSIANDYIATKLEVDTNTILCVYISYGVDTNQARTVLWYEYRFKYKYINLPYFGIVISPVNKIQPDVQCVNYGEKYFTLEQNTEFADEMRQQLRSLGLYEEDPPVYGTEEYWWLNAQTYYYDSISHLYRTYDYPSVFAKDFVKENVDAWYTNCITGDVKKVYIMYDTNIAHTVLWYQCIFSSGSSILISHYKTNQSPIIAILRNVDYQLTWNCGLTETIAHDERIKLRHWHLYEDDVPNPDYPICGVRISKFNVINDSAYITVELKLDDDWLEYCRRTNSRLSIPIDYSIYACKQLNVDWKCIKPMYKDVSDEIVSEYLGYKDYDIREIWWYKNCPNSWVSLSQIDDDVIRFTVHPYYLIGFNQISLQDYIREGYRFFKVNVCVAKYRYEFYKQFIKK